MAGSVTRILVHRLPKELTGIFRNHCKALPALTMCVWKSDSSSSRSQKILSVSTLLLQDGLDIHEQPLIIRWMDSSKFPFEKNDTEPEVTRQATAKEEMFMSRLQKCTNIDEVFELLEVPGDQVTGYSASYALQRLCTLKKQSTAWNDLESFICKAVMNELYTTVRREISTLSNEMLFSMVNCLLNSPNFCDECAEAIKQDVEKRIGDTKFTITELCQLSSILQGQVKYQELLNMIWVHVGNRYTDIDQSTVSQVLLSLPRSQRHIASLLDKQNKKFFWKLSSKEIVLVLNSYVRLNYFSGSTLRKYGRWVYLNMNKIEDTDLMQIVSVFIHFNFVDKSLIQALEHYVTLKGTDLDTTLLAIIIEYCRGRRYLLPRIMDAAAVHFSANCDTYKNLQIYSVLRSFGYLNYLPEKSSTFLSSVEKTLMKEFDSFNILHLLEILCSFAFVRKQGENFIQKIMTVSFRARLKTLDPLETKQANIWLEYFRLAALLETSTYFPNVFKNEMDSGSNNPREQRQYRDILKTLLGQSSIQERLPVRNSKYFVDFRVKVKDKCAVDAAEKFFDYGLAILIHPREHCCTNSPHLLGEFAMRNRHIALLMRKHQVVELTSCELETAYNFKIEQYVIAKLSPYIDFS